LVAARQPITVTGKAIGTGGAEPHVIDSVMVGIDGSGTVTGEVTPVPHQPVPTVRFAASVAVPAIDGPHQIMVSAVDDVGLRASTTVLVTVPSSTSSYPRFTPTPGRSWTNWRPSRRTVICAPASTWTPSRATAITNCPSGSTGKAKIIIKALPGPIT
jgi:hypothetical protein